MNIRKGKKSQIPKIIYLTFLNPQYSRSAVNFQNSNSINKFELIQVPNTIFRLLWNLVTINWENRKQINAYVIMSPCHILVIFLRILTRKKIILDAGWSMTEATLARNANKAQLFKSFIVDFLSFHFANLVLLESRAQIEYSSKMFCVRKSKLRRLLTGFNEKQLNTSKIIAENRSKSSSDLNSSLQIIFRGSYNSESGIELIIEAAKKFVAICTFVIVCRNFPKNIVIPSNVVIINKYLTWEELEALYANSILALGQISNHPRLQNTIPHKAFEAAFFGKAYVTCDTSSIRELFPNDNDVFYYDGRGLKSFIDIISEILNDRNSIAAKSKNIRDCYYRSFSQEIIQKEMMSILREGI